MAKHNIFIVYDCEKRKNILVTPSARKARDKLVAGIKIEVWNENELIEKIYINNMGRLEKYVNEEKQYIMMKQASAEQRNKRRKDYGL